MIIKRPKWFCMSDADFCWQSIPRPKLCPHDPLLPCIYSLRHGGSQSVLHMRLFHSLHSTSHFRQMLMLVNFNSETQIPT